MKKIPSYINRFVSTAFLSILCHAGLLYLNPNSFWFKKETPKADVVSVELLDEKQTEDKSEKKENEDAKKQDEKFEAIEIERIEAVSQKNPARKENFKQPPQKEKTNKPKTAEKKNSDPMQSMDMKLIQKNPNLPDPEKNETEEATITLGETDERYRPYLEKVRGAINMSMEGNWREALLSAGRNGKVVVLLYLDPGGEIIKAVITESSGSDILDKAAASTIKNAMIPAFPEHWTLRRLNLIAQFEYSFE